MGIARVLLHLGETKTGSTALQQALLHNEAWLADRDFWVLRSERHPPNAQHERFRLSDEHPDACAEVDALRRDGRAWTVIVSSESFLHLGHNTELIAGRLARVFGATPLDGLVYVRHPLDWVQSSTIQRYRGNQVSPTCLMALNRPLHEIPDEHFGELCRMTWVGRFHERLGPIARRLGCRSLTIRPYHRPSFPDGSILRDVLIALGLEGEAGYSDNPSAVNPSLPFEAIVALHRLIGLEANVADHPAAVTAALGLAGTLGGQRSFLRPSTLAAAWPIVSDDHAALMAAHPNLEPLREPMRQPAAAPDEQLVDRYLDGLVDHVQRATEPNRTAEIAGVRP